MHVGFPDSEAARVSVELGGGPPSFAFSISPAVPPFPACGRVFRPNRAAEQSPSAPTYCRSRPTAADVSNLTKLVVNIQHLAPERDLAKGVSEPSPLPGRKVTARTGSRHIPTSGHTAEVPSLLAAAGWATPLRSTCRPSKRLATREFIKPSCSGDDIIDSREPQTMPRHRVIARGDGHAGALLKSCDRLGDPQAGA